jgi:mevalonate kinase
MIWHIPAKTFLLGEYVALNQGPALILTTKPCFTLSLTNEPDTVELPTNSPAARLWQGAAIKTHGLHWQDPYQAIGGLGASSAQFIATYLAICHVQQRQPSSDELLRSYYQYAFSGQGLRPSGYDVIAQSKAGCVFIDKGRLSQYAPWPFAELSFILLHTGVKLATHEYLQAARLPEAGLDTLANLVYGAHNAFQQAASQTFIEHINAYHSQLTKLGLVAEHSLNCIQQLQMQPEIAAIKGCGAQGADVLLVLAYNRDKAVLLQKLAKLGYRVLAVDALYDAGSLDAKKRGVALCERNGRRPPRKRRVFLSQ